MAAVGLIVAAATGAAVWMLLALLVMLASLAGGAWYAMSMPQTHLDEFRQALHHGEILLMVDVSRDCVEEIQVLMERRHPEATIGGNGWSPGVPGISQTAEKLVFQQSAVRHRDVPPFIDHAGDR